MEAPSAVPSYHSLDAAEDENDAAELSDMPEDVAIRQPGRDGGSSSSVRVILFQFFALHSYIGMLIVMMV